MAFIVLAIGMLMVVAGGGEIAYGAGMIEVERGWSTFIAGTVLLTGGLLTAAIGLALRALGQVTHALARLGQGEGSMALSLPASAEVTIPAEQQRSALRGPAPALASHAGALQIEPNFDGMALAPEPNRSPPLPPPDEARHDESSRARELTDHPATAPGERAEPEAPENAWDHEEDYDGRDRSRWHDGPDLGNETVEAHRDDANAVHTPGDDDHPAASVDHPDRIERSAEIAIDSAPATAPLAPPPPPPQAAAASQANVIGRYESDGTSYVMYADGSIEAQSEAGIYRFGSMAELKSFIER